MEALIKLVRLSEASHPEWGMYIHICRAIKGTGTSKQQILGLFNKVMPEDEYDRDDKKELIEYLIIQSKTPLSNIDLMT